MMTTPPRAALYLRISLDREGKALGVQRQETLCRALAEQRGWLVAEVFRDNDTSASRNIRRPGYEALLTAVRAGEVDKIVSYSLKRLVRRWDQGGTLLDLAITTSVGFGFARAGDVDLSTASGRDQFRGMVQKGIYEVEELGERVADAATQRAELGRAHGGRRPFGFEVDQVTPRPSEFDLIKPAVDDLLSGVSLYSIAQQWNRALIPRPGTPDCWHPPMRWLHWEGVFVSRTLRNPRYCGIRVHNGERLPAPWPAAVDEATHLQLVDLLRSNHPAKRRPARPFHSPDLLGSGAFLCAECGARLLSGGHNRQGHRRYHCVHGCHMTRKAEPVDEFVRAEVARLLDEPTPAPLTGESGALATLMADEARLRAQREEFTSRSDSLPARIFRQTVDQLDAEIYRVRALGVRLIESTAERLAEVPSGSNFSRWPTEKQREVLDQRFTVRVGRAARGAFDPASVTVARRS